MLDSRERAALSSAFLSTKVETTRRLVDLARAYWSGMGNWRDSDVERFLEFMVPRIQAGRSSIANLTAVYLARVGEVDPIAAVDTTTLRGLDASDVYTRPAVAMRTALKDGASVTDSIGASLTRLASLVATDMALAQQAQTAASTASSRAFDGGFRRTLTGSENCAKCYIASTQRYHRGDLLPIHPGCDCGVEPLRPGENTGRVLDPDRLATTNDWAESMDANRDNLGDLLVTHDHGEYGPTLSWRDQKFTGPSAI